MSRSVWYTTQRSSKSLSHI